MLRFDDRFAITSPALASADTDTLTDAQLETFSPAVAQYASTVRQFSVLLKRKTTSEIYKIATAQSDPRIALILAAARDKKGVRIFPDLPTVKEVMFGATDPGGSEYVNNDYNIFVQGVERISAALTAAVLIAQLSQLPEQYAHAKIVEEQALADLNRLLAVPDLTTANAATVTATDEGFYFQPAEFDLDVPLVVELYMPSTTATAWQVVNTYNGNYSTANLVADLADAINSTTLSSGTANILAAPVLGDSHSLYKLDFKPRNRDLNVSYEVITVRMRFNSPERGALLPFRWGINPNSLNNQFLNSVMVTVLQGKSLTTAVKSASTGEPTVLYFKRAPLDTLNQPLDYTATPIPAGDWKTSTNLSFRISPTMTENQTVKIPYVVGLSPADQLITDQNRPSVVAQTLLNSLFALKADTKALGAIIRNDDPTSTSALVALELVAFSVSNPDTWLILDVLELPPDVLMATGTLTTPLTPFSNKPRSIRVSSHIYSGSATTSNPFTGTAGIGNSPNVSKIPASDFLRKAQQQGRAWEEQWQFHQLWPY